MRRGTTPRSAMGLRTIWHQSNHGTGRSAMNARPFLVSVAVAISAIATTSACHDPTYPKCENDGQCRQDKAGKPIVEYCVFGQCAQCAKDDNCAAGEKCNRGRCDKACTDDSS